MRNPCLAAALDELAAAGIRNPTRAYGGKHLQLRWEVNGAERMYSLPATPSDHRAAANTRAGVRRLLKTDGLLPDQTKPVTTSARPRTWQQEIRRLEAEIRSLQERITKLETIG